MIESLIDVWKGYLKTWGERGEPSAARVSLGYGL